MEETLKELAGDLQMIHQSLERAEAVERQLGVYWREFVEERDQLRAEVEKMSKEWNDLLGRYDKTVIDLCAAESTAAGLRRALEDERSPLRLCNPSCQEGTVTRCMCRHCVDGRSKAALAASPDEHELRIKAEALRGLKNMSVRKLDGHYVVFLGHIEAEAELLEKEAVVLDAMETEENG